MHKESHCAEVELFVRVLWIKKQGDEMFCLHSSTLSSSLCLKKCFMKAEIYEILHHVGHRCFLDITYQLVISFCCVFHWQNHLVKKHSMKEDGQSEQYSASDFPKRFLWFCSFLTGNRKLCLSVLWLNTSFEVCLTLNTTSDQIVCMHMCAMSSLILLIIQVQNEDKNIDYKK